MVYTTIVLHKKEYEQIKEKYGNLQLFLMQKYKEEFNQQAKEE